MTPHTRQNGRHRTDECRQGRLEGGPSCVAGGLENSVQMPQKTENNGPAKPLLRIYPEKAKTRIRKALCTPTFTAALRTTAKTWQRPGVHRWAKTWGIYLVDYRGAIKTLCRDLAICNDLEESRGHHDERNKSEKDKCCMVSVIRGI